MQEAFITAKEIDETFAVYLQFFQGSSFKSPSAFISLFVSQVLQFSQFFRLKQSNQYAHYDLLIMILTGIQNLPPHNLLLTSSQR